MKNNKNGKGGDGGDIKIFAKKIQGSGKITADGGNGNQGGKGGSISITTDENKFTGEITTKGGNSNKNNFLNDIPLWLKYLFEIIGVTGIIFTIIWSVYIYFNPKQSNLPKIEITSVQNVENDLATTTLNISNLISKALSLETLIERQDLLEKYRGDKVYGKGEVKQISRWGNNKFLIDIKVDGTTISCEQDGGEENEKRLLLLKGKIINYTGIFRYLKIPDHGQLKIEECQIL